MNTQCQDSGETKLRLRTVGEWAEIERTAYEINTTTLYNAAVMAHEQGIHVHVIDASGRPLIDVICELPDREDSPFSIAGKRRALRITRVQMQKLIKPTPLGGAA